MAVTTRKVARQPRCWPSSVAPGTPTMLASGEPQQDRGDRPALPALARQPRGHDRGDAEERAVRQPGREPPGHQPAEAGARADSRLPATKRPISATSRRLRDMRTPAAASRGAPDDHADRVGGDEGAGGGHRGVQVGRDDGQQAHDHELADAQAERADRQGQ